MEDVRILGMSAFHTNTLIPWLTQTGLVAQPYSNVVFTHVFDGATALWITRE